MELFKIDDMQFHIELINGNPTLTTAEVAKGYGVAVKIIYNQADRNTDEFIEGAHYHTVKTAKNTPRKLWTLDGIIRLGFFIKSGNARRMRDLAQELTSRYLIGKPQIDLTQYPLQRENIELKRTINRMTANEKIAKNQAYIAARNYEDLLDGLGEMSRAVHQAEEAMRLMKGYANSARSFFERIQERCPTEGVRQQCERKRIEPKF